MARHKTPLEHALQRIALLTRPVEDETGEDRDLRAWEVQSLIERVQGRLPHTTLSDEQVVCLSCFFSGPNGRMRRLTEEDLAWEMHLRGISEEDARKTITALREQGHLFDPQSHENGTERESRTSAPPQKQGRARRPRLSIRIHVGHRETDPATSLQFTTITDHLEAWLTVIDRLHRTAPRIGQMRFMEDGDALRDGDAREDPEAVPRDVQRRLDALAAAEAAEPGRFPLQRLVERLHLDASERAMLLCVVVHVLRGETCEVRDLQAVIRLGPYDVRRRRHYFNALAPLFFHGLLLTEHDAADPFGMRSDVMPHPELLDWLATGDGDLLDIFTPAAADAPYPSNRAYMLDLLRVHRARRITRTRPRSSRTVSDGSELFRMRIGENTMVLEQAEARMREIEARAARTTIPLPLVSIVARYGLTRTEQDILLIVLERTIAQLDTEVHHIGRMLASDPLEQPDLLAHFTADAPLVRTDLLDVHQFNVPVRSDVTLGKGVFEELMGEGLREAGNAGPARSRLAGENTVLETVAPTKTLGNLVLPPAIMEVLRAALRRFTSGTEELLAAWGIEAPAQGARKNGPRGALRLLLSGAPGTGKTLAAHALAGELGVDLLVTDMSRVLSSWVGNSEKNVRAIFDEYDRVLDATDQVPVLLLNECDQFLQRRSEADSRSVDRMYHQMQNLFLERLELFRGILVATTNLVGSLDAAFSRRFDHKIVFPLPDEPARRAIWRAHMPASLPLAADVDVDLLARAYPFSGAQIEVVIRNAALAAAMRGDIVSQKDLRDACDREVLGSFDTSTDTRRPVGFISTITDC